jgi:hypothetical protein
MAWSARDLFSGVRVDAAADLDGQLAQERRLPPPFRAGDDDPVGPLKEPVDEPVVAVLGGSQVPDAGRRPDVVERQDVAEGRLRPRDGVADGRVHVTGRLGQCAADEGEAPAGSRLRHHLDRPLEHRPGGGWSQPRQLGHVDPGHHGDDVGAEGRLLDDGPGDGGEDLGPVVGAEVVGDDRLDRVLGEVAGGDGPGENDQLLLREPD